MRGKLLPERVEPYVLAALGAIGVDPNETAVYWKLADINDWRILVAAPIGLLAYTHAEQPVSTRFVTTLTSMTSWGDVLAVVETTTERERNADPERFFTRLEMELKGHTVEDRISAGGTDLQAVSEFVAECLRRSLEVR